MKRQVNQQHTLCQHLQAVQKVKLGCFDICIGCSRLQHFNNRYLSVSSSLEEICFNKKPYNNIYHHLLCDDLV